MPVATVTAVEAMPQVLLLLVAVPMGTGALAIGQKLPSSIPSRRYVPSLRFSRTRTSSTRLRRVGRRSRLVIVLVPSPRYIYVFFLSPTFSSLFPPFEIKNADLGVFSFPRVPWMDRLVRILSLIEDLERILRTLWSLRLSTHHDGYVQYQLA